MSEQRVRDAMVSDPHALDAGATAQEAGEALMRPEVRSVLVCDGGPLRRRDHAKDARARGGRPRARPANDDPARHRRGPERDARFGDAACRGLRVSRGRRLQAAPGRRSRKARRRDLPLVGTAPPGGGRPSAGGRDRAPRPRSPRARSRRGGVATASSSCSRISLSMSRAVLVELLVRVTDGDLDLGDTGAHRGEHLAKVGLRPHRTEHPDARADHRDRLARGRRSSRSGVRPSRARSSSAPGIDELYSGVAKRTASADATAARRSATA